jgi:riboflavin kinase/FMN adenylyltransferase
MEIYPGLDALPPDMGYSVVTIGMFDGLHRGHRRIIRLAHDRARELGIRCVVLTFDRHPLEVLNPEDHPKLLTTGAQKLRLLEEMDVDIVLMVHFDEDFASITAYDFLHHILLERLHAQEVVLGENFRFGRHGEGDVEYLRRYSGQLGFRVHSVPLVRDDGEPISSTLIRSLIERGEVERASRLLGRDHLVEGIVVEGTGKGRELGFPTANLEVHDNRCLPAPGVYAGAAFLGSAVFKAAVYVGKAPTFDTSGKRKTGVEAYLLGWKGDLYGRYLGLSFRTRIRGDQAFPSVEALREQIARDVERVAGMDLPQLRP